MKSNIWRDRPQTVDEEIANSISHGFGFIGTLVLTPVLIIFAARDGNATSIVAASVFGATMILTYLMSTLYHALPNGRAKRVFNILDHSSIFGLIAGTYTPFTLVVLSGGWGWSMFGLIWGLALAGIIYKAVSKKKRPILSTSIYVAMSWLLLIAIKPLWNELPSEGFLYLGLGGLSYMLGVLFYTARGLNYSHFIWHFFVLGGTTLHFIAVFKFAI